jgi:dTDP-4-dehydrorhamnose 3,5-epimerase
MSPQAVDTVARVSREDMLAAVARAAQRDARTVDSDGKLLPPSIEGVRVKRLGQHIDHRGGLTALLDVRDPFWEEPVVYAYEFTLNPGRIKGWGMHEKQTDRYFVSNGALRVVLFDGRESSPTSGSLVELHFGELSPGLVSIPPGVWHADHNWGPEKVRVLNFPTLPYDPDDPDKLRIDPHAGIIPFDWALRDG